MCPAYGTSSSERRASPGDPSPDVIGRNAGEHHAHVEPEEQRLGDEIIPEQEQRAEEEERGHDRIAPRAIASLEIAAPAPQHEYRRHRERVERPDPDDELVGQLP